MKPDRAHTDPVHLPVEELLGRYPQAGEFFDMVGVGVPAAGRTAAQHFATLPLELLDDLGLAGGELPARLRGFLALFDAEPAANERDWIESITVVGGHDKSGAPEGVTLTVRPGEIVCIVGATGSGKSRFLADIEWLAQGDSPTGRTVLINGVPPEAGLRFAIDRKLVAQLSQNMNFVIDLTVREFITMHAQSRQVQDAAGVTDTVIALANSLAGESFLPETPVTALSGGQSRALMIADTSCLSASPIVLIDEIENAGIDRKRAVQTLVDQQKIVLMATHDPILALLGDRRIVFKNGGIARVIETSAAERARLVYFENMDAQLNAVRQALRNGESIGFSDR